MTRQWVCFDIGEVLIDETRIWSTWADVVGVPRFTFMGAMGVAIARGGDHVEAFAALGIRDWRDREAEVQQRYGGFAAGDLYPDALPALRDLAAAGFGVAVIGNQPTRREAELRALGLAPDVMVMSDTLGVQKPSPEFFAAVVERLGAPPSRIAYVGDRLDNDVRPAAAAGLHAVWLRRGPWALSAPAEAGGASLVVDDLGAIVRTAADLWDQG